MPRVLVTPIVLNGTHGPWRESLEKAGFEIVFPAKQNNLMTVEGLLAHVQGVDAVLAGMEPFNRTVLEGSRLRVVSRMGVGYDAVDLAAASERNVAVAIAAGSNEDSVAEQTIALILGIFRDVYRRDQMVRRAAWTRISLPRLAGRTLGLVGLGRIGRAVVARAQGLGLKVIASDPMADRGWAADHQVRLCSFEELLRDADIVSLHAPNTPDTYDLINSRTLAMMKPGSVVVNTARGSLIDEDALYEALKSGHLLGAGLDVFKVEPLPANSPLIGLDNILLAPHMAGLDIESVEAMGRIAAQCIVDLYQGRWPEWCVVNRELRPKWKW
jgi:D-3-phosphoglycerate dehydrogenase